MSGREQSRLFLLLAFFMVCIPACRQQTEALPSDSSLESRFERIHADLELIRRMSDEDASVIRIASDFTWLADNLQWPRPEEKWGISRARWDTYRSLFKRIGCPDGIFRRGRDLYITCGTRGLVTDGSEKGYAYILQVDPQRVVEDLDVAIPARGRPYFKPIAEPWYLFVD